MASNLKLRGQLVSMSIGHWISRALYMALKLDIPQLLADKPKSAEDLAALTNSRPEALRRLLHVLANIGVLRGQRWDSFRLTAMGRLLLKGKSDPLLAFVKLATGEWNYAAWEQVAHSIRTGESASKKIFGKAAYDQIRANGYLSVWQDRFMTSSAVEMSRAILRAYQFPATGTLVDVAGGSGSLLAAVLRHYPRLQGILIDNPSLVAIARKRLESSGLEQRCKLVRGDIRRRVPSGGDAYLLARVLHSFSDLDCSRILKSCHRAMTPGSKLIVIQMIVSEKLKRDSARLADLNMLVVYGGHERSRLEFQSLLQSNGFRQIRVIKAGPYMSVVEAIAR